jgi:hypothetical protein
VPRREIDKLDYLKSKKREGKESVRDFINFSRQILLSHISIGNKKDESEMLKEYIMMEQEKLEEKRWKMREDKESFDRMMKESQFQTK